MGVEQTLGHGETFVALDKAWTLMPIGPGIRAKFGDYCKMQALADQRRLKDLMGTEEYREDRALLYDRIHAGEFTWGTPLNPEGMGEAVRVMLNGTEGKLRLLQLMLHATHGEIPGPKLLEILADAPEAIHEALRGAMGLPRVEKQRQDRGDESIDPFVRAETPTTTAASASSDDDGA